MLVDKLTEESFLTLHVCEKYAQKKFLKASIYAIQWARLYKKQTSEQALLE
jgi:G2/mitotic-specific cyclin 2